MTTENHCMSLQCGNYPTFLTYECVDFLPPLCSTSILVNSTIINWSWTQSMKICKMNDTYLLGNINLSNVTSACLGNKHESPYWIGIFREKYFNTDQGQPIEQSARKFFNKCQRCKLNNEGAPECELVGCEKNLKKSAVICSESVATESSESLSSTDAKMLKKKKQKVPTVHQQTRNLKDVLIQKLLTTQTTLFFSDLTLHISWLTILNLNLKVHIMKLKKVLTIILERKGSEKNMMTIHTIMHHLQSYRTCLIMT
eukprot:XP_019927742.1 PREDICTED: uncharacterized protein LOC105340218 isoform X5 [Crassostrea gigas]